MKHYTHLTREQRYHIARGSRESYTHPVIADIVDVHKSILATSQRVGRLSGAITDRENVLA